MQRFNFTDAGLRKLSQPQEGTAYHWDTNTAGLGIRIGAGGAKTFVLLVTSGRRKTLGRFPTISLADARVLSRTIMAERTLGKHLTLQSKLTVEEARTQFLDYSASRNRPRTVSDYKRLLTRHLPTGRLARVSRKDLLERLKRLQDTPGEQYHASVAFQVFLRWCVNSGLLETNPIAGARSAGKIEKRDRILTHAEITEVLSKSLVFPGAMGRIIALCITTGQRVGEVGKLLRYYIRADTITLPSTLTKNGQESTFPFGALTASILANIPNTGDILFPGRSDGFFRGYSKSKAAFDATLENVAPYNLHDLRRSFVSLHAELGTPMLTVEKHVNHISGSFGGVRGIYDRWTYLPEMRTACERYENFLLSLVRQ